MLRTFKKKKKIEYLPSLCRESTNGLSLVLYLFYVFWMWLESTFSADQPTIYGELVAHEQDDSVNIQATDGFEVKNVNTVRGMWFYR